MLDTKYFDELINFKKEILRRKNYIVKQSNNGYVLDEISILDAWYLNFNKNSLMCKTNHGRCINIKYIFSEIKTHTQQELRAMYNQLHSDRMNYNSVNGLGATNFMPLDSIYGYEYFKAVGNYANNLKNG